MRQWMVAGRAYIPCVHSPTLRTIRYPPLDSVRGRGAMALATLSGDEQCIIFVQLCNTLDPGVAVAFGSINSELRALTPALLQQLRADYEAAAALGLKMDMQSCKELREANTISCFAPSEHDLSAPDLALLGTLGSVLPALERLTLQEPAAGPDGMQRLAERLGHKISNFYYKTF